MSDISLLEEAYKETVNHEIKRKAHYIEKGRKGYFCKLCSHFRKNVKSPNGDEFFCNKLKIYINKDGLCSEYKTSQQIRSKQPLNMQPNTLGGNPASNRSAATRGNDMHSDPQVSQTPV